MKNRNKVKPKIKVPEWSEGKFFFMGKLLDFAQSYGGKIMLGTTDIMKEIENLKRTTDANTLLLLEIYARVDKLEGKK